VACALCAAPCRKFLADYAGFCAGGSTRYPDPQVGESFSRSALIWNAVGRLVPVPHREAKPGAMIEGRGWFSPKSGIMDKYGVCSQQGREGGKANIVSASGRR
jgi:hypothetical protein